MLANGLLLNCFDIKEEMYCCIYLFNVLQLRLTQMVMEWGMSVTIVHRPVTPPSQTPTTAGWGTAVTVRISKSATQRVWYQIDCDLDRN